MLTKPLSKRRVTVRNHAMAFGVDGRSTRRSLLLTRSALRSVLPPFHFDYVLVISLFRRIHIGSS